MKIIVSGGAGFIGSHAVDELIRIGHKVAIVDNFSTGKRENVNPGARLYEADITAPEIAGVFDKEKPEAFLHFAAQVDLNKSIKDPQKSADTNILGSINVLENCVRSGVKKFIFTSSGGAIYGEADTIPTPETYLAHPLSPYGIEKLTIENYLHYYNIRYGLGYFVLRYANIYGPRQDPRGEGGVVAIFCDKMKRNELPVINGSGRQTRDFVYVADAVQAATMALERTSDSICNISTGRETDINSLFRVLKEMTDYRGEETHDPDKCGGQLRSCLDWSKAKKELDWSPKYSLEDGLRLTVSRVNGTN